MRHTGRLEGRRAKIADLHDRCILDECSAFCISPGCGVQVYLDVDATCALSHVLACACCMLLYIH